MRKYTAADLGIHAPNRRKPFWVDTGNGLMRIPDRVNTPWMVYLDSMRYPEKHRIRGISLRGDFSAGVISPMLLTPAEGRDARFRSPMEVYANIGARFTKRKWRYPDFLASMELIHGEYSNTLGKDENWNDTRINFSLTNYTGELLDGFTVFYGSGMGFDWVTIEFGSAVMDTLWGRPTQIQAGDAMGLNGYLYGTLKTGLIYELNPGGRGGYALGRMDIDLPIEFGSSARYLPPHKFVEAGIGAGFHW